MNVSKSKILNLFLVREFEKEQSNQKHVQSYSMHVPGKTEPGSWHEKKAKRAAKLNNRLPSISKETKWANTSINHNLKHFLMFNDLPDTGNPFNNHSLFEDAPILSEGWIEPIPYSKMKVNPGRPIEAPCGASSTSHFLNIFSCIPFDKNNPICLDRKGRILDGYRRMYAKGDLWEEGFIRTKVYVRIYDFE